MLPDRIIEKIEFGLCWEWIAAKDPAGYGAVKWEGKKVNAHRLVWELLVSSIPDGLFIDHLCRNRACVNPDHLEPVTPSINNKRGFVGKAKPSEIVYLKCGTCNKKFPRNKYKIVEAEKRQYKYKKSFCSMRCVGKWNSLKAKEKYNAL